MAASMKILTTLLLTFFGSRAASARCSCLATCHYAGNPNVGYGAYSGYGSTKDEARSNAASSCVEECTDPYFTTYCTVDGCGCSGGPIDEPATEEQSRD